MLLTESFETAFKEIYKKEFYRQKNLMFQKILYIILQKKLKSFYHGF